MATSSRHRGRPGPLSYLGAVACGVFVGIVCTAIAASHRPSPGPRPRSAGESVAVADRLLPSVGPSVDGAVRTAVTWVCSGGSLLATDPLGAEKTVRAMATAAEGDRLVTETLTTLRQLREKLAGGTGPVILHQAVLATRVSDAGAERARIELWNVSVLSREGIAPPQSSWTTSTVDLAWEREGWRVAAVRVAPGPAPILSDGAVPATAAQLADAVDGFVGEGGRG